MTDREIMQQALDALTYCEAMDRNAEQQKAQAITALRTALEQPEQESVAWTTMPEAADWCFVSGSKDPTGKLEGKWFPLYNHPPQRKPLTEVQQIAEALRQCGLSLLKTEKGYEVLKLGPAVAHNIK